MTGEWKELVELMRCIPGRAAQIAQEAARLRDEMAQFTEDVITLQTLAQGIEDLVPMVQSVDQGEREEDGEAPTGPAQ